MSKNPTNPFQDRSEVMGGKRKADTMTEAQVRTTVLIDRIMDHIIANPEVTVGELAREFGMYTREMAGLLEGEGFRDALALRRQRKMRDATDLR